MYGGGVKNTINTNFFCTIPSQESPTKLFPKRKEFFQGDEDKKKIKISGIDMLNYRELLLSLFVFHVRMSKAILESFRAGL